MPDIDFTTVGKPKFKRPELLQDSHIVSALHGLNPRKVKGRTWWDAERRAAYKKNNYFCWVCNVGDIQLHGHERYDVDYQKGLAVYIQTVALCNECHMFIHSGFYYHKTRGNKDFRNLIERGIELLESHQLALPWSLFLTLKSIRSPVKRTWAQNIMKSKTFLSRPLFLTPDRDWRLQIGDKKFRPS